jgi:hypothetical protein
MAEWKKNTEGLDGFTAHPWEWAMGADTLAGRVLRFSALFVTFASFITIVPLVAYFIHGDRVIKAERREMEAANIQTESSTTGVSKENEKEDTVAKRTEATAEPAPAKDKGPEIPTEGPSTSVETGVEQDTGGAVSTGIEPTKEKLLARRQAREEAAQKRALEQSQKRAKQKKDIADLDNRAKKLAISTVSGTEPVAEGHQQKQGQGQGPRSK